MCPKSFAVRNLLLTAALSGILILISGLIIAISAPAVTPTASRQLISYRPDFFKDRQVSSALDMINNLPGFDLYEGDDVRGFAGSAGNVLIDGERPNSKSDGLSDILNRLPASSVERIDLIIGGAEGIDMQGQTKIANVIRNVSDKPTITLIADSRLLTNGWVRPVVSGIYSLNRGDKSFEVSAIVFSNFDEDAYNGDKYIYRRGASAPERLRTLSEAGGEGVDLKGSWSQPVWGGKLSLNGQLTPNRYKSQNRYINSETAAGNFTYEEDFSELGAQYSRTLGKSFTLKLSGLTKTSDEDMTDDYVSPSEKIVFNETSLTRERIVSGQLIWKKSNSFSVETGLERAYNILDSDTRLTVDDQVIILPASKVMVEEDRTEASILTTWQTSGTLTLESGVKYEWSTISQQSDRPNSKSFEYLKPKLQLTWTPKPDLSLSARFEREISQLDFDDFVSSIDLQDSTVKAGNVALEPSKSWVSEATLTYRFWDKGAMVAKYKHAAISDVIDRVPVYGDDGSVFDAKGNIGDGTVDEFSLNATLPTDRLKIAGGLLKLGTLHFASQTTDPVTGLKRRLSNQLETEWEIAFTQNLVKRKVLWGFNAFNGYDYKIYRVSEVSYARGSAKLNLFSEYKPNAKLVYRIELNNLTGRRHDYDRDRYDGPRSTGVLTSKEFARYRSEPWLFVRVRKEI